MQQKLHQLYYYNTNTTVATYEHYCKILLKCNKFVAIILMSETVNTLMSTLEGYRSYHCANV